MLTLFIFTVMFPPRAAAESKPMAHSFACDLKTKTLPRVVFIGEEHSTPSSEVIRNRIISEAARGKYPALVEVASYVGDERLTPTGAIQPWDRVRVAERMGGSAERSHLLGLESPIPYAVFSSYRFRVDQLNKAEPSFVYAMNIVDYSRDLPLMSAALKKTSGDAAPKDRLGRLTQAMLKLSNDPEYAKMTNQQKISFFKKNYETNYSESDFETFAAKHHAEVIKIVNSNYLNMFDSKTLPYLANLADKENFGCRGTYCEPTGRLKEILVDQRDRDFAYTVADELCAHAGKYSDVVVGVGHNHVGGMIGWLKRLTNDHVQTVRFRSDGPADLDKIEAALKSVHELPPGQKGGTAVTSDK